MTAGAYTNVQIGILRIKNAGGGEPPHHAGLHDARRPRPKPDGCAAEDDP